MRKAFATLMVLCMLITNLTACGNDEATEISESVQTTATETTESEANDTDLKIDETVEATIVEMMSEPEITTTTTSNIESSATVSDYSEEEQIVIDIARKGYTAMVEKDYEAALKYINFSEGYYLTNGEWVSDERVIQQIKEATGEDDNNMFVWFAAMEDMEFLGAQQLTPDELQEYNDYIPTMAKTGKDDYLFDDAYKVFVDYPAMSESEKELIGTKKAVHLLVVKADEEWKLDLFVASLKEIDDYIKELQQNQT